ncbi:MAG: TIGR00159 family protein [Armatimonadetes bacterium]|nr:TIGR00159 family protein [Armatimonadota bacterium]
MKEFFTDLFGLSQRGFINVLDILLVAYLNYRILKLIRGTRAWRIVVGVFVFLAVLWLSDYFQFGTLHWILEKATILAPVAIVILFLPELRQAVEGFGKLGLWTEKLIVFRGAPEEGTLGEIATAVGAMAEQRIGALIVIERGAQLANIADTGVPVHAKVSAELIGAIFYHGNPLHDGAIVIRGDEVLAAACRLPMSDSRKIDTHYHMRHRAGVGMSEQSDAIVIIVSEERGDIMVAQNGELQPLESEVELREFMSKQIRNVGRSRLRWTRKQRDLAGSESAEVADQ